MSSPRFALRPAAAWAELHATSSLRRQVGIASVVVLVFAGSALAAGAAQGTSFFVPASRIAFPGWMRGPLYGLDLELTPSDGSLLLIAMFAGYLGILACARALPVRLTVGAAVMLHGVFLLAPPLFSADVFAYIDYGRLALLHHANPYLHGAAAAPSDQVRPFVLWRDTPSTYGPLFTLLSVVFVPLGVAGALWALKTLAALAGLACMALTWRIARLLGHDPLTPMLFVGLNPLLLAYEVGGGHNDLLMMTLLLAGAVAIVKHRDGAGGALLTAAAWIKPPAGLALALAAVQRRSRRLAIGAGTASVAAAASGYLAFGSHTFGFLDAIQDQQAVVALDSVPGRVLALLSLPSLPPGLRFAFLGGFVGCLALLLFSVARHRMCWLRASGWAMLALLATSAWLLPWYLVWVLPLAGLSRDRMLQAATVAMIAFVLLTRTTPWLPDVV
jgi:alpha-1,6-mannosyltransferase